MNAFITAKRCVSVATLWLGMLFSALAAIEVKEMIPNSPARFDEHRRRDIQQMYNGYRPEFHAVPDIGPRTAAELAESRTAVFIDVRTKAERSVSRIPGALPADEFSQNRQSFRDKLVIPYCTIGYRSGLFAKRLQEDGFRVRNLAGGILAWTHAGLSVECNGTETNRIHVYGARWNLLPQDYQAVW